jgi:cephalosporin hydroxylase
MPLLDRAVRLFGRGYRRLYLPRVDTLPEVRRTSQGFTALRDEIREAGTDSLDHFGNGYAFEGGLSLQQNPDEFAALCMFLGRRGPHAIYLEIGSASGGACLFLYRKFRFSQVISMDDGGHPRAIEQERNFAEIPGVLRYVGDSHAPGAARFLEEELAGPVDVAFVDGDHSYSGVMQDIDLVRRFLRPGSLLVLHDTVASTGVERAWLRCIRADFLRPVAEYVGTERPLGIGIAEAL